MSSTDELDDRDDGGSDGATEEKATEAIGARLSGRARSLANLRPAWPKGTSGNRSGLTADGLPSNTNRIRGDLQERLADPKTRHRFVKRWIEAAIDGDAKAREQILQRLDPVSHDDQRQGVVVFEGIKLELVARTSATSPAELSETARDVEHTVNPSHPSSESIALESTQESRGFPPAQRISADAATSASESRTSKD